MVEFVGADGVTAEIGDNVSRILSKFMQNYENTDDLKKTNLANRIQGTLIHFLEK